MRLSSCFVHEALTTTGIHSKNRDKTTTVHVMANNGINVSIHNETSEEGSTEGVHQGARGVSESNSAGGIL